MRSNTNIDFSPGGQYESLPLTVKVNGGSLRAVLRLQISLGVELTLPPVLSVLDVDASIGNVTDVFTYIADITMNVENGESSGTDKCNISADLEYTLAVGAAASATLSLGSHEWGPDYTSTIPIYTTTLASTCAKSQTAIVATAQATQASSTSTDWLDAIGLRDFTSDAVQTYTITQCASTGLVECPVSLQSTIFRTSTGTPAGTTESSVSSTIKFGTNVARVAATSGAPTTDSSHHSILDGTTNGRSNKLTIGLCVGLGVPFLAALAAGVC